MNFPKEADKIPWLNCSIGFDVENCDPQKEQRILEDLSHILNVEEVYRPRAFPNNLCITFCSVRCFYDWEIDTVIKKTVSIIDSEIESIRILADRYHAECVINVWFESYGSYPVMLINPDTIKKIAALQTYLDFDIYDCGEE